MSLQLTRATGRLISAGDDGTVFVYGDRGRTVVTKLRSTNGCKSLGLSDRGERLLYTTNDGWLEHRGVSTNLRYPVKGQKHPQKNWDEDVPKYTYDRVYADFNSDRFALAKLYHWDPATSGSRDGSRRLKPTMLEFFRFSRRRSRRNDMTSFGTATTLSVDALTAGVWAGNCFVGAWGNFVGIQTEDGRYVDNRGEPNVAWAKKIELGSDVRCLMNRSSEDFWVWGGTEDGRLFRVDATVEFPVAEYWRIPDTPLIECLDVSPDRQYLAVGVDYGDYGAILVYTGLQLTPVLMIDTGIHAPTRLAWRYERNAESPDSAEPDEALTLFSGHGNGNVCKWHVARQLRWQGLLEERVQRSPAASAAVRVPDPTEENFGRVIDV